MQEKDGEKYHVHSSLNPSFLLRAEGEVGRWVGYKFHKMSVLGEKVKGDYHESFPKSEIFSYSMMSNSFEFEFFFSIF